MKKVKMIGKTFGRLVVLSEADERRHGYICWVCLCECGNEKEISGHTLRAGNSNSCGCLNIEKLRERSTTHGLSDHELFDTWNNMMQRCYNENDDRFTYYGARGITVCDAWKTVEVFFKWCYKNGKKEELQIDRIDNNAGYSPDNCRFVTRSVNMLNTRMRKNNTSGFRGVTLLKSSGRFKAQAMAWKKQVHIGCYSTAEEAALARDSFVTNHNLGHRLNFNDRGQKVEY